MNKERLLNVAKALRESPNPETFSMEFFHRCGTPACALGHYAARADLQSTFELREGFGFQLAGKPAADTLMFDGEEICEHFGITQEDAYRLFRDSDDDGDREIPCGCGGAQTAIEAAEWIERFVAAR